MDKKYWDSVDYTEKRKGFYVEFEFYKEHIIDYKINYITAIYESGTAHTSHSFNVEEITYKDQKITYNFFKTVEEAEKYAEEILSSKRQSLLLQFETLNDVLSKFRKE